MAKQIILTQNNFGIPIELQFVSNINSPIDLTDKTVEVAISYDGTIIDVLQATISSYTNGTAYIVTTTRHTSNVGLYTTFWSVKDRYGYITAQEDLYYYVKGEYNGAENNDIEQDKGTIKEEFDKVNSSIEILDKANSGISARVSKLETNVSENQSNISSRVSELETKISENQSSISTINNNIELLKNKTEENKTTLSNLSNSLTENYQTKTSDKLKTTSKDVVGAINEIKDFVNTENSMNENGYYKLPNGLIIQWGSNVIINTGYEAETKIVLPKTVQKIFCPMVTLHDMEDRVVCSTYDSDTTGFTLKLRSVANNSGTGHGIGAIRINWFVICK